MNHPGCGQETWSLDIFRGATDPLTAPFITHLGELHLLDLQAHLRVRYEPRWVEWIFWEIWEAPYVPALLHGHMPNTLRLWAQPKDIRPPCIAVLMDSESSFAVASLEDRHTCLALLGLVSHSSHEEFFDSREDDL